MNISEPNAQSGLIKVYSNKKFTSKVHFNSSDHGYIGTHLIERSIAILAQELHGDFIDVGCGTQPYRCYFKHIKKITACDIDTHRGNVDFACPADNIPLEDISMDSILCTEVLEHVPDPLAVWREFYRLLRPGGKVLLTTPMYWPPHELPYDFFRYPEHGIRYLVEKSGFRLLEIIPRGGPLAFWGQATIHVWQPIFQISFIRHLWNVILLKLDRHSTNPRLTLGWTVLAEKES